MTVPMLDELIQLAAAHGAREVVVGMAHRGRLNVLAHNLGRPVRDDLRRVRGRLDARGRHDDPAGRHRRRQVPPRRPGLLPAAQRRRRSSSTSSRNPSHLEFVHPVVVGATRAAQTTRQGPHAHRDTDARRADRPARRRRLPGPGRRRRDAEPPGARRLQGRRHAPPDQEQPGRLHHRPRGRALDAVGLRPRQGLRRARSSTSTPTTWPPASPPCAWPSPSARSSATTSSSTSSATAASATTRPTSPPTRSPRCTRRSRHKKRVSRALRRAPRRAGRRHAGGGRAASARRSGTSSRSLHQDLKAQIKAAEEAGQRRAADRRVPARPLAVARGQDRGRRPSALRALNEELLRVARGLHRPPQARQAARAPARGARRRRRHRLGARRGARLRLAADRGHAGPPDRPGRRARHVLPAPPGPARRQDRPDGLPDPEPARRAGAVRAAQLAAERDRLPGLRVRLLAGGARDARALGGAVRRLRQRRAGHHRPVHRLRPGQVGPDLAPDAAAARTATRARAPSTPPARLERFLQLAAEGNIRVANLTTPAQYFHLLRRQARDRQAAPAGRS